MCFNEAAAYHCGKPRRDRSNAIGRVRFNEAAAYHCGKRTFAMDWLGALAISFNEAAAYHCGKRLGG